MVRQIVRLVATAGILGLAAVARMPAAAQETPPPPAPSRLVALVKAAAPRAITATELAAAKAKLAGAVSRLDALLRQSGRQREVGWKQYLRWNDLVGLLQSTEPPSAELVDALIDRLRANHAGLEMEEFTAVRDALAEYAVLHEAAADPRFLERCQQELQTLAQALETYTAHPGQGDAALAAGRALHWLARRGQASEAVAAIQSEYAQPNLTGYVSARLAAAGIEQPVDEVSPVQDLILGTRIHGTARMVGHTSLVLDDNPRAAGLRIMLTGTAHSSNVGYNGPVTIYSRGTTSVSASKAIEVSAEGLSEAPAHACCVTRTTIDDICARCGMIERMAWKRAGKQQGRAEAIASEHAAARVAGQMDRQAGTLLAEQRERYEEKFRDPLRRRGAFPEEMVLSSTPQQIGLRVRCEGQALAAPAAAMANLPAGHDLAVRAHESVIINFAQDVLGGYELTDLRLEKLIRDDLKAELPDELRVTLPSGQLDPDKEPWSIQFARELPIRAKFDGGTVWLAIRADRFTRGEGDQPGTYKPAITELVEISATYRIEKTEQGATLRRDGDVQVRFLSRANPDQITVRDSPIVTFIRRKFRSLFKEEFVGQGLTFQGRWQRAGTLKLAQVEADRAWLVLGWTMPAALASGEAQAAVATHAELGQSPPAHPPNLLTARGAPATPQTP